MRPILLNQNKKQNISFKKQIENSKNEIKIALTLKYIHLHYSPMINYCHSMFIASINTQIYISFYSYNFNFSFFKSFLILNTYSHSLPIMYTFVYTIHFFFSSVLFLFFFNLSFASFKKTKQNKRMEKRTPIKKVKTIKKNCPCMNTRVVNYSKLKQKQKRFWSSSGIFFLFCFFLPYILFGFLISCFFFLLSLSFCTYIIKQNKKNKKIKKIKI